jgi:hypothetical protein
MKPGWMVVTRMPLRLRSTRSDSKKVDSAALLAL